MLLQIPPEHFSKLPARCLDDIQRAMKHAAGERDILDVLKALYSGQNQLWLSLHDEKHIGTLVTEIVDTDQKRICVLLYAAGDLDEYQQLFDDLSDIERWAAYNGCDDVRIIGRPGWTRLLKSQGYDQIYVTVSKSVRSQEE